jgi:hypothetical protein
MIEPTNLPYIDLGAGADALRKFALEYFGKKISHQAKDETVIDRFREIYKEETGVTLADVEPDLDEDDDQDEGVEGAEGTIVEETKPKPKPVAVTINVQEDEKDTQPIVGSVQFVPYRIMRNVNVRVSMPILTSLQNAMKTVYDPKTMESREVPMYPFSIVEYHF